MNAMHVHLIVNHIPVLATIAGLTLLLLALWRRSEELKRLAMSVFVIGAIFIIPTYLTGEPAEDGVKGLPGIASPVIEKHEEAAGKALAAALLLGGAALGSLLWFRHGKAMPVWLSILFLIASVAASGFNFWTANLGGQVRHSEIRSGSDNPSKAADRDHD